VKLPLVVAAQAGSATTLAVSGSFCGLAAALSVIVIFAPAIAPRVPVVMVTAT